MSNIKKKLGNLIDRIVLWIKKTLNNLKSTFSKTVITASYDAVYHKYTGKEGSVSDEDFKAWKDKWGERLSSYDLCDSDDRGFLYFNKLSHRYYDLMKAVEIYIISKNDIPAVNQSNDLFYLVNKLDDNELSEMDIMDIFIDDKAIRFDQTSDADLHFRVCKKQIIPGIIKVVDQLYESLNNLGKSLLKMKNILDKELSNFDVENSGYYVIRLKQFSDILDAMIPVNKKIIAYAVNLYKFTLASSKDLVKLKK